MYPNKTLTLGDFRKATEGLPDDLSILYAWTWSSPSDVCLGGYMGSSSESILLDGNMGKWEKQFGNKILWEDTLNPDVEDK